MNTAKKRRQTRLINEVTDFGDWNEVPTSRTKLFARWVKVDGRLICEWISE